MKRSVGPSHLVTIMLVTILAFISACASVPSGNAPSSIVTSEDDHDGTPHEDTDEHSGPAMLEVPDLQGVIIADGEPLRVVATTSIIGDVVRNVAGGAVELTVLMVEGQDPHSYQPTASDLTTVSQAHIVFVNGWDLEEGLVADLEGAIGNGVIVPISAGITPLKGQDGDEHAGNSEHDDGDLHEYDPHVWFDTANVKGWIQTTERVLSTVDEPNAATYAANARAYETEIEALEGYIRDKIDQIPTEQRKLVTNHDTLRYFAHAHGFEIIGTILPGDSTGSEPSAADLTELIESVNRAGVKAVFIENTVGDGLASVLQEETGARVYELYTDAVGPVGSGADSYIGMMKADVDTLVEALAP